MTEEATERRTRFGTARLFPVVHESSGRQCPNTDRSLGCQVLLGVSGFGSSAKPRIHIREGGSSSLGAGGLSYRTKLEPTRFESQAKELF